MSAASPNASGLQPGVCPCEPLTTATKAWLVALLGWSLLVAFYDLSGGAGFDPPDVWVAQTAREMLESRDWEGYLIPTFSGETRMQKSPGPYWTVVLVTWARGELDAVAARIPSAVSAVLLVFTIAWLTLRIAGQRAAIFAGYATAASVLFFYWSHRAASDLGVTTLMTISLAAFWVGTEQERGGKRAILWMIGYLAAGLAMLYKMPMPLACVGIPAVAYVLFLRRERVLWSGWHLLGLLLFLLPWLPWALHAVRHEEMALSKWIVEFWDRLTGDLPNVEEQRSDWKLYFLYLGVAFAFCVPFSLSLPQALWRGFRRAPGVDDAGRAFLLIWFLTLLAFFTFAAGKETRYFLPAMPPLLCLLGMELAAFFDPKRRATPLRDRLGLGLVWVAAPAAAIAGGIFLREFCRKMEPYGTYPWAELGPAYVVAASLFVVGACLAAWLYARRCEGSAFGALVGTMWLAGFWVWSQVMPVAQSQAPFRDFAARLAALPVEYRPKLRQIAHQDARVVWYSDVRYPRIIDQLELLKLQGGRRNRERETELVARRMFDELSAPELRLLVSSFEDFVRFHVAGPPALADAARPFPKTYVWITGGVGRPDQRYVVYGNQPPPWPAPAVLVPDGMKPEMRAALPGSTFTIAERTSGSASSRPATSAGE